MRRERGYVTAEAALVIPFLIALTAVLVWVVSIGVSKVRAVDAARDVARDLARGETPTSAADRPHLPPGWHVRWSRQGEDVTVTIAARAHAPRWLIVPLPDVDVSSHATVRVEPGVGAAQ